MPFFFKSVRDKEQQVASHDALQTVPCTRSHVFHSCVFCSTRTVCSPALLICPAKKTATTTHSTKPHPQVALMRDAAQAKDDARDSRLRMGGKAA